MDMLATIEIVSGCVGMSLLVLLCLFPRFGPATWTVVVSLVLGSVASMMLSIAPLLGWSAPQAALLAFVAMLMYGTSTWLATYTVERADFATQLKDHRWFFVFIGLLGPSLAVMLYFLHPPLNPDSNLPMVSLGSIGYGAAAYLLIFSVVGLANIEQ